MVVRGAFRMGRNLPGLETSTGGAVNGEIVRNRSGPESPDQMARAWR